MILLQRLLALLALLGLAWFARRLFSASVPRRDPGRGQQVTPPRAEEAMVRDHVCNTFLPRSRAVTLDLDDGRHFFCSERCREIFRGRLAG